MNNQVLGAGLFAINKLIFLNGDIQDLDILLKGIILGSETIIINPDDDGIQQISEHLKAYQQPVEVHLISHGCPGHLSLGCSSLNLHNINHYANQIKSWNISTLVLYGCNVAAGDAGSEFINKLAELTSANIVASTTKTGNPLLGGNWTFDVSTQDFYPELPFQQKTLETYSFTFPTSVTGLTTDNENLDPDTGDSFNSGGNTFDFQVGDINNRNITGFTTATGTYGFIQLVDKINIERVDNNNVTGNRQLLWFEQNNSTSGNNFNLKPTFVDNMEEALLSRTINRGTDNVFQNAGNSEGNQNNIERIDFISTAGLSANSANNVGFLILDRGVGDPFKIAAITAINAAGEATAFGPLTTVNATNFGTGIQTLNTSHILRKDEGDTNFSRTTGISQNLSGVFISYGTLGISNNQTFYGYAIVAPDVPNNADLTNPGSFPRNTGETGGLDLVGGGGVFALEGFAPPVIDLDTTDNSGTSYQTTFSEGSSAVAIASSNVGITDPDSTQMSGATIVLTNRPDGDSIESLSVDGTLPGGITASAYDPATGTITLTGPASLADYQQAISQIQYNNTSNNPDTAPRIVEVFVNDGQSNSNIAQATININLRPVANDDTALTNLGEAITFNITANDTDSDGTLDLSTVDLDPNTPGRQTTFTVDGEGTYTVDDAGNVTFTPVDGFTGVATPISYTVADNNGAVSNPATITVTVNDPPVANDDTALTNLGEAITFNI
ncbi:MAG: DUF4347 domain-containing protein, partial [Arthrospira sp. PLM2.Bin9]